MRPAVLIYNPASGSHRARRWVPQLRAELKRGGYAVEATPTEAPGDATRLAREAARRGAAAVFVLGGDGTIREAAAGLLGSDVPLGPLPSGTANVLSLALGLPRRAPAAAAVLASAEPREIDVGLCGGEPFLMMASAGLDAAVMGRQSAAWKRRLGRLGIAWGAWREWWSYPYPPIEVRLGDRLERVSLVVASNIPFYGGGLRIAPAADPADGRLDVLLFHGSGRTATLRFARDLLRGRHLERADVEAATVRELEILAPERLPLQLDGDTVPLRPPLAIGLASSRLRVLAPAPR